MIAWVWRSRWGLARLALAAFLLWAVAVDTPRRLAGIELRALPGFDYAAEVASLRAAGRYGEALMVADAGLAAEGDDALSHEARSRVEAERAATIAEQSSWLRRAKDAGMGALSGTGDSLESLIGAVAADFFIVGDVRDLVIQGGKLLVDGEGDPVIAALSGVGLATTLAPEVDWVPSLLKAARKAGTLSKRFAEGLVDLLKAGKRERVLAVMGDVGVLSRRASPGGAMRLLRHADDADELAALARFVERERAGAFALHVTQDAGARLVKSTPGDAAAIDRLVVKASRRGEAGRSFLRSKAARALTTPHPLVGVGKAVWKGNGEKLAQRLVDRLAPGAWWLLPTLAAWVFVEGAWLVRRWGASVPPVSATSR